MTVAKEITNVVTQTHALNGESREFHGCREMNCCHEIPTISNNPGKPRRFLCEQASTSGPTVTFDRTVHVREIPYTDVDAAFLSEQDYGAMEQEIALTLAILESPGHRHLIDDVVLCSRGVFSVENLEQRTECSFFVRKMVLSQYAASRQSLGMIDVTRQVAAVYEALAKPASKTAQDIASIDHQDALEYLTA